MTRWSVVQFAAGVAVTVVPRPAASSPGLRAVRSVRHAARGHDSALAVSSRQRLANSHPATPVAIQTVLDGTSTTHADRLMPLITLIFQEFENVSLLAA